MKTSLSVNSSDLERARGLARRLAGVAPTPARARARSYVRFVEAAVEDAREGARTLDQQLAWCLQVAGVDGILVVDRDGLVVARAGDWPEQGVESVAARLVVALEQAELVAGALADAHGEEAPSVCIESGGTLLTGLRVSSSDASYAVGLLGRERVAATAQRLVRERIRAATSPARPRASDSPA